MPVDESRFPDIKPRRGPGPVGWVVFLVVLGFIVWLVVAGRGEVLAQQGVPGAEQKAEQGRQSGNATNTGGNATLTEVQLLAHANNPLGLVGQTVKLDDVRVLAVTPEHNFWVGDQTDRVFVVQRHYAHLPDANNTNLPVQAGDTVSLTGEVKQAASGVEQEQSFGLQGADAQELQREGLFVLANQVQRKK